MCSIVGRRSQDCAVCHGRLGGKGRRDVVGGVIDSPADVQRCHLPLRVGAAGASGRRVVRRLRRCRRHCSQAPAAQALQRQHAAAGSTRSKGGYVIVIWWQLLCWQNVSADLCMSSVFQNAAMASPGDQTAAGAGASWFKNPRKPPNIHLERDTDAELWRRRCSSGGRQVAGSAHAPPAADAEAFSPSSSHLHDTFSEAEPLDVTAALQRLLCEPRTAGPIVMQHVLTALGRTAMLALRSRIATADQLT